MSISEKMVTIAENMEKVFLAGASSAGGGSNVDITDEVKQEIVNEVISMLREQEAFDLTVEEKDGTIKTYKVYGFEVK